MNYKLMKFIKPMNNIKVSENESISKTSALKLFCFAFIVLFLITSGHSLFGQLPSHFYNITLATGMKNVEGVVFDHNKRMYAWEKNGKIIIIDSNGVANPAALLNIVPEVGNWNDHGLNGLVLDPDFKNNGFFYVNYVVDRHHLLYNGTLSYNKDSDEFYNATIARVTRYTADPSSGFNKVVPGSRKVIIGSTKFNGIPVTHKSHGSCAMVFGTDGTLLIATGDGAAYGAADNGAPGVTYSVQALLDSIITPELNVGAFRSQMIQSINGKILRIDPNTGNGVPSNPYYDPNNPASAQSKVWCLGLRNPYTISLKPGTGSTNPADGNPGTLYIGDVGWDTWEELNIADKPKLNFGWPIFEGLDYCPGYGPLITPNYLATNPLFGMGGCTQQYFNFQELLKQATLDTTITFRNPCDTSQIIPDSINTFFHARTALEFRHHYDSTQVGIFNGSNAAIISVDDSLSPCKSEPFGGDCIIDGMFYQGDNFPSWYKGKYFFGEFEDEWIRAMTLDTNDKPTAVNLFAESTGYITHITENPFDGTLVYVKFPDEIHKICYACMPDMPPVAIALADTTLGGDTLKVNFDGSKSSDPDNSLLSYSWNFGDNTTSTLMNPQHFYTASAPGVSTTYIAVLTVTDDSSHTSSDSIYITLNNTAPVVNISSFNDGDLFSSNNTSALPLSANVFDAEQDSTQLFYEWKVISHRNGNDSVVMIDSNKISTVLLIPQVCPAVDVYYKIIFTVTDIYGETGIDSGSVYPDCNIPAAQISFANVGLCQNDSVYFIDASLHFPIAWLWTFTGGSPAASTLQSPVVYYTQPGIYSVTLVVTNILGIDSITQNYTVNTNPTVNLGNDTAVCANTYLMLNASNVGATYLWSTGSTIQTININVAGTYTVTVVDANGCKAKDEIVISAYTLPVVSISAFNDTVCVQAGVVNIAGLPAGGIFNGSGMTGNVFDPAAAGLGSHTVQYIYTDSLGCSNSDSVVIWVDACLSIPVTDNNGVKIYPNPTHDKIYISTGNISSGFNFVLSEMSGKTLLKKFIANSKQLEEISLKGFAKGIYLIQISNAQLNYYRKIVIE